MAMVQPRSLAAGDLDLLSRGQFCHRQPDSRTLLPGALVSGAGDSLGARRWQRRTATVSGALVALEFGQGGGGVLGADPVARHYQCLCLRPYALSRQGGAAQGDADFPDVPASAVAGGALCAVRPARPTGALARHQLPWLADSRFARRCGPAYLDHQGLLRIHRRLPGGGRHDRWSEHLAGVPAHPAAAVGADFDGGVHPRLRSLSPTPRSPAPHPWGGEDNRAPPFRHSTAASRQGAVAANARPGFKSAWVSSPALPYTTRKGSS